MVRPFRFSVVCELEASRKQWIEKARRAEALGYTTFLVPDHFSIPVDPVTGLLSVVDATSMRVGSHVFCNDFRHPVVLARQLANLDLFSDGRFQFGLGCGYLAKEYEQAGIPFDPAGVRIARMEEALHIIKAYFEQDEVNFEGRYYTVRGLPAAGKTVQSHIPLYLGGGNRRMLSVAAREADIVGVSVGGTSTGLNWPAGLPAQMYEKIEWVREAAQERFEQIELSTTIMICAVTNHRNQAAYGIGQKIGLDSEKVLQTMPILVGTVDDMVEALQWRREQFGISAIEVTERDMEAFAPVVARLTGK